MIKNGKAVSATASLPKPWMLAVSPRAQPWTLEERRNRIQALGQRIDGYVRFMCQVGALNNASGEVKEKAVTAFYDRMVIVEKQLAVIHDHLRLE